MHQYDHQQAKVAQSGNRQMSQGSQPLSSQTSQQVTAKSASKDVPIEAIADLGYN